MLYLCWLQACPVYLAIIYGAIYIWLVAEMFWTVRTLLSAISFFRLDRSCICCFVWQNGDGDTTIKWKKLIPEKGGNCRRGRYLNIICSLFCRCWFWLFWFRDFCNSKISDLFLYMLCAIALISTKHIFMVGVNLKGVRFSTYLSHIITNHENSCFYRYLST